MKKRLVLWGAALSLASIATAASFHLPQVHVNTDPDRIARELGVDPTEYKQCKHEARQLSSDLCFGRPAKETEVDHLVEVTKKGGAIAGEIYWNLVPIRKNEYRAKFVEAAVKSSDSKNESEAFAALSLLKYWNDSRWHDLAAKHVWQSKELQDLVLEPRQVR